MKLASMRPQNPKQRNGDLVVVSSDNRWAVKIEPTLTLLTALESWSEISPRLRALADTLNTKGSSAPGAFALDMGTLLAPITNGPGFYDGSAFLSHVQRARQARGDKMPDSARVTPLMYQGVSDNQLPWNAPIDLMDPAFGGDFEGEFAVITTDVPKGTRPIDLERHFALFVLFNDITYREIVKTEIETKFGFLQSKPNSAFAPFAVTPDEVGGMWNEGRLHADLEVKLNGKWFGNPHGGEMHFSFHELVAHACRTRPLSAGTIVGTGTVSNEDKSRGFTCLTEKRFVELIEQGKATTPWLRPGDRVEMQVMAQGVSLFGPIDETVK